MAISHLPTAFTYPVITADRALAAGISAGSLAATADWNQRRAKGPDKQRRLAQAAELRRVAAQLAANDNGERRVAA
ncbi:MAG TPA: hypothetical protein VNS12_13340 [Pelagibacterium sp.]|uniref:hypothetical protein n=1 Tax=Pelagibacterium sp. TaxID=1967288 RepID=UPI002B540766|nr:hypothetical protein [Pelagibacterium sp.]HWJ89046.1 hypothetical protein [Pelagibacterium sp.]